MGPADIEPGAGMEETNRNALASGHLLGGYEIESVLGSGGFGITYRARELIIERMVAIKEYLPSDIAVHDHDTSSVPPTGSNSVEDYEWGLSRFRQEAQSFLFDDETGLAATVGRTSLITEHGAEPLSAASLELQVN